MLIGRENEVRILREAVQKEDSQFIAVYGRRRVGKTFLIREVRHMIISSHSNIQGRIICLLVGS